MTDPPSRSVGKHFFPFCGRPSPTRDSCSAIRTKASIVRVSNGKSFSYPGYSETLCGFADPWANSNAKRLNPNQTVLEWLYRKPRFEGKIAAFGAWDVFPYIFNRERCGFYINAGYEPMLEGEITPKIELLNELKKEVPRHWPGEPFDALTFHTAREYFRLHEPRVFYLSMGESDEWAHEGRYDEYLMSAHRIDAYVENLWRMLQSNPRYRDQTTLIYSPDHGRGHGPTGWKSHSDKYPGSENIWIAVIGPDTPSIGRAEPHGAARTKPDRRDAGPLPGRGLLRRCAESGQTDRRRFSRKKMSRDRSRPWLREIRIGGARSRASRIGQDPTRRRQRQQISRRPK